MDLHQEEPGNDRDVAHAIRKKAPALAQAGDQNTRDCGADYARAIEHRRIQCDGIHQVFLADHIYEEGLATGNIEGIHHSQACSQYEDVPDLHLMGQSQSGQDEREHHGSCLRCYHYSLAVRSIRGDSPQRRH